MSKRTLLILSAFATLSFAIPASAEAQLGGLRDAAKRTVERRAQQVVVDKVSCALADPTCVERAKSSGQQVEITDADGNVITNAAGEPVQSVEEATTAVGGEAPGSGVWRNYDFVPGAEVWFALDLENEPIGRFPASQLEFKEGNGQVVEIDGGRALELTATTTFFINLPEGLPEDYTLEFDAMLGAPNFMLSVTFDPLSDMGVRYRQYEKNYLSIWRGGGIAKHGGMVSSTDSHWEIAEEFVPIKFQNDGNYAIVYMGSDRVANVPNADFGRSSRVEFHVNANQDRPTYIRNLVLAVGLDDLYGALSAGEAWTTRGILFDVNSDVLRPESSAVLQQIERTLNQNGDLSIVIEGHTDSTGDDAHNQDLSERRAQSVVAWLAGRGIAAGRLSALGKGESDPVADNATSEGRQENRRVVIRKA